MEQEAIATRVSPSKQPLNNSVSPLLLLVFIVPALHEPKQLRKSATMADGGLGTSLVGEKIVINSKSVAVMRLIGEGKRKKKAAFLQKGGQSLGVSFLRDRTPCCMHCIEMHGMTN